MRMPCKSEFTCLILIGTSSEQQEQPCWLKLIIRGVAKCEYPVKIQVLCPKLFLTKASHNGLVNNFQQFIGT